MNLRFFLLGLVALAGSPALDRGSEAHEGHDSIVLALTDSIQQRPTNPRLYLQRGEILHRGGHLRAALADFARAETIEPERDDTALCRADVLVDLGQFRAALQTLDLVPEDGERASFFRIQSRAYEKLGDSQRAIATFDRSLELDERLRPDTFLERVRLVLAHDSTAFDEALAGLDRGLEQLGPSIALLHAAVDLEIQRGAYAAALERLDAVAPLMKQPEVVWARRGDILQTAGRDLEARAAYTESLAQMERLSVRKRRRPGTLALEARVRGKLQLRPVDGGESGAQASTHH